MTERAQGAKDFEYVWDLLRSGDTQGLEEVATLLAGFPNGEDPFLGRRWIMTAVDSGCVSSVEWMIGKGVPLDFRDDEGRTPLHAALDLPASPSRTAILEFLLSRGASPDLKGPNDWTPAHHAAALDDVEALRVLVKWGADFSLRTEIDDYATPLEEARILRKSAAEAFLAKCRLTMR